MQRCVQRQIVTKAAIRQTHDRRQAGQRHSASRVQYYPFPDTTCTQPTVFTQSNGYVISIYLCLGSASHVRRCRSDACVRHRTTRTPRLPIDYQQEQPLASAVCVFSVSDTPRCAGLCCTPLSAAFRSKLPSCAIGDKGA